MTTTTKAITQAQLDACQRSQNVETGEVFYTVESATSDKVYEVRALKVNGAYHLTCNCPAVAHCWHKRAAAAAAAMYKTEQKRLQAIKAIADRAYHLMEMGLTEAEANLALKEQACQDDETLVRVYGPKHARPTNAEIERDARRYAGRGFSLLK